jgi:hypothetical protein
LNSKDDEALLNSDTLLERRAALCHISADGVVVDIRGELKLFIYLHIQLLYNHSVRVLLFLGTFILRTT